MSAKWHHIVLAGAIGGLLAWFIILASPGADDTKWWASLGASLLGGAIFAGAAVYLLANTDTSNFPRAICFAAVCGVFWIPIKETVQRLVVDSMTNKPASKATADLEKALNKAQESPTKEAVAALADSTNEAAAKINGVTDRDVKAAALDKTLEAVASLRKFNTTHPELREATMVSLQSLAANPNLPSEVRDLAKGDIIEPTRTGSSSPHISPPGPQAPTPAAASPR